MKGACPIKTSPDWVALEKTLGEDNTWKIWMSSRQDILPEPVAGGFFLFLEAEPAKATALLNKHVPLVKRQEFTYNTSALELIENAKEDMFNEPAYKEWLDKNKYLSKIFEGEKVKRTEEEEEKAKEKYQTLEEIANEVPDDFVEPINVIELQNKMRKDEIIYKIGQTLGKDFVIVTAKEANLLLNNSNIPYQGQYVFSLHGKYYMVEDRITLNTTFSELSIPFINSLRLNKKEDFNKAYAKFLKLPQAEEIMNNVDTMYPTMINKDSDIYKELVLAEALKYDASLKNTNSSIALDTDTQAFQEFIKNDLLYKTRQQIRGEFGKVKADKLKTNTPLTEIAKLLQSDKFKIETEEIKPEDVNNFNNELEKASRELIDAIKTRESESKIMSIIDDFIQYNDNQLKLTMAKPYWDIKKVIADEQAGGYLRDIAERLKDVDPNKVKNYANLTLAFKTKSLVSSLFTLDKTLNEINKYLENINNSDAKYEDKLKDVAYAHDLLKQWSQFISDTENSMLEAGVPKDSYIFRFVATLDASIKKGRETFVEIQEDGAVKTTTDLLNYFAENITKQIDEEINSLEKQAPSAYRDKLLKEAKEKKEKYTFTEDKIKKLYTGELGDSNFWSTMFESYSTNPDPIISTFALFLKKHTSEITANAFMRAKEFSEKMTPLMDDLGMTGNDPKKEFSPFLTVDEKVTRDADGKLTRQSVLSLISAVKSGRYDLAEKEEAIEEAKKANDPVKLKQAYQDKEDFLNKYFNREYVRSYYEDRKVLEKENYDAFVKLEEINMKIKDFRVTNSNELDAYENNSILDMLLKEREKLYSVYDDNGVLKSEKDQKIAKDLSAHRKKMGKYYDFLPKKGQFQREFEAFSNMISTDPRYTNVTKYSSDGSLTDEFKDLQLDWLKKNSRVKYTQAYYDRLNDIYTRLAELSKEIPKEYRVDELYRERTDLLIGYRDSYGQTDPGKMINRDKIFEKLKNIQEDINRIQDASNNNEIPVSSIVKAQIKEALKELSQIQFKQPTEYYLDELNEHLLNMNIPTLDAIGANELLKDEKKLQSYFNKSANFKNWFNKNHVTKEYEYENKKTGVYETKTSYQRLSAWSVAIPIEDSEDDQFIEKTTVKYENETYIINGIPSNKYSFPIIKEDFRTVKKDMTAEEKAKYVNNRGEYLPLSREQFIEQGRSVELNDPNSDLGKYINDEYYAIMSDPKKAEMLKVLTEYHIKNQTGLDKSQKLYLDIPRFPVRENLELLRSGKPLKRWVDRIKSIKNGIVATLSGKSREEANIASAEVTDIEEGLGNIEFEEDYQKMEMAKNALLDPVIDKIPMRGLSNVPIEEVSYDLITSFNLYMLQAEKQKVFNEIAPVAQAMLNTLENLDEAAQKIDKIKAKQGTLRDGMKALFGNKGTSNRVAGFKALYNREFKGKMYDEKHLDWANKVTAAITKGASINYFALNLPSAVKNYWGIIWQLNVEAAAGEYFDYTAMAKGKYRSKTAMSEWTTRVWGGNYNTIDTQLIMLMDPLEGKADESLGKDASRTLAKDVASLSFIYSPRKFMEMEGGLQLFYSMMYYKKIPMIVDGRETKINYADAFEMDEKGRLKLKDGIDSTYGITYEIDESGQEKLVLGKEFIKMQNAVHEKFKDLNGAFAKFEQPQAQQYFAYRLFAFMRRYFTTMFMSRFGKDRANFALGTVRSGYYIEAVQSLSKIISTLGQHIKYLQPSEKRAMMKMLVDVGQKLAVAMIAALLFGYDDDDEDRFEKLKAKSGALGEDDFKLTGFLSNQALTLLLKTEAENMSFIPLPGFGLDSYLDLTSSTSLAFGPTITSYAKIITDLSMHALPGEDEDLFYKKDTGPYPWQKEGEAKIWNHFGTMVGFSGSQVDPVKGLQSFESFSRR
jgi:hypothetical protein